MNWGHRKTMAWASVAFTLSVLSLPSVKADQTLVFSTMGSIGPNVLDEAYGARALKEAYDELGIQFTLVNLPARRALKQSNRGLVDGELVRIAGIDKKFKNLIPIPIPLYDIEVVAFGNKSDISVSSWEDLTAYNIGFLAGMKIVEKNVKGSKYVAVPGMEKLLQLVDRSRVALGVLPRISLYRQVSKLKLTGLNVIEPPLMRKPIFHYLHKKHQSLVPRLTKILQKMQRDGRISELAQAYKV